MIKKFLSFSSGQILVFLLNLASYPVITRLFPPEEMGKYSMALTVVSFVQIVCAVGMDQAFVRYFYDEDENARASFLLKCMKAPCLVIAFMSALCILFYRSVSYYIVDQVSGKFALLFVIQSIFTIVILFLQLFIRMEQRAKLYSGINVLQKLVYIVLAIGMALAGKANYLALVLANAASVALGSAAALKWGGFHLLGRREPCKTQMRTIAKYSFPFVFSMSLLWLFHSSDKIMLKMFSGYHEVGIYSGAMAIVNIVNVIQGAFTVYWTPVSFERYSQNPGDIKFFQQVNEAVSFLMLLAAGTVILFKDLVVLFLGGQYREAVYALPYLIFIPVMYTISETTVMGINFKEKSYLHIWVAGISTACNVAGNWLLVPKYGARGAAIATGLSYIVFFAARTYFSIKCYQVNYSLLKLAVCSAGIYLFGIYASFSKFSQMYLLLGVLSLGLLCAGYRNVIWLFYDKARSYVRRKKGSPER